MPDQISHAEMIAGLERVVDRLTLIDNEFGVCVLRRAIALLKPTNTQADLTERARVVAGDWAATSHLDDLGRLADYIAAFAQSERDRCPRIGDDVTERARTIVEEFRAYLCEKMVDLDEPEVEWMTKKLEAALQSEREAEREKVAAFMLRNSIATGHGDTTDDLLNELQGRLSEREATAAEARRAAIDACTRVCSERAVWAESKIADETDDMWANYSNACDDCAELVAALASPAPQEEQR